MDDESEVSLFLDDVKFMIVMEATMIDKIVPTAVSTFWKATIRPKNQVSPHLAMVMQLTQKQRQAAKLVITPILHQQTQQLVEIQLLLHPQPLQTQQLAIRQLVTPQLVALFPTKTKKRLGNPCLFSIIL